MTASSMTKIIIIIIIIIIVIIIEGSFFTPVMEEFRHLFC